MTEDSWKLFENKVFVNLSKINYGYSSHTKGVLHLTQNILEHLSFKYYELKCNCTLSSIILFDGVLNRLVYFILQET